MPKRSPLAPQRFPRMFPVAGVRVGAAPCGIRYRGRSDLFLAEIAAGATVAGVFTKSRTASAPVDWCRSILGRGRVRAILVNSGNANAFTGADGAAAVARPVAAVAKALGCRRDEVFVASTGVIGVALPDEKIVAALPKLRRRLAKAAWQPAAEAIMTTDTFAKGAARKTEIDGVPVTICGIAKGSGMIAPNMGTMLGFLFTDAKIPAPLLQRMLVRANARSFNSITVDGDTSTSDTVLLCATGKASRHRRVTGLSDAHLVAFRRALDEIMVDLAQQIVRDGEGARKLVTIAVTGAKSEAAARNIGLAVGNSPLVKTAIAGADANWGRIVMAVGKAGEEVKRDRLDIRIGGVVVAEGDRVHPDYQDSLVAEHMRGAAIDIAIDVGVGRGRATIWTCDLTHGYIDINADYRS